jgi:hypothetical protein
MCVHIHMHTFTDGFSNIAVVHADNMHLYRVCTHAARDRMHTHVAHKYEVYMHQNIYDIHRHRMYVNTTQTIIQLCLWYSN